MTTQQEFTEDLIDTDPLEILNHMDQEQLARTIRAIYYQENTKQSDVFVKSLVQFFYDTAWEITEKKLNEANVYQGPFDQMYDMGHSHGDFLWLTILEMSYFYIQKVLDLKKQ